MDDPRDGSEEDIGKLPPQPTKTLDKLEQLSRISVPFIIPIVVALIGYFGNEFINRRQGVIEQKKVDLEYVKVAKDVASNVKPDTDPLLVRWAYDVLFKLSPVHVSQEDVEELSNRRVPLPSSVRPTVVGGINSSVEEWPWLVSIYREHRFNCNGTVIAPRMVLSAANCVAGSYANELEVATAVEESRYVKAGRRIPVIKVIVHPSYSANPEKDDIAILELATELQAPFAAISSESSTDPRVGEYVLAAVLNFQSESGNLRQIAVPIVDGAKCDETYQTYSVKIAAEGTICAGFEHGGAIACPGSGSAGAPVVIQDRMGHKYQIGIVALGQGCNGGGAAFGVYTRISSYADWIKKAVPDVLSESVSEGRR